jgi:hypothetical protein
VVVTIGIGDGRHASSGFFIRPEGGHFWAQDVSISFSEITVNRLDGGLFHVEVGLGKGANFLIEISDLEVITTEDKASKEMVETPNLSGRIKISNKSEDNLDIQALTLEYLDADGKPIDFQPGEKITKASLYFRVIKPGESFNGQLDVTIPMKAIKEKTLGKIEINLVYVASPLDRETATFPETIE